MSHIKLYGYATSPFVRKVGAFLMFKQLSFEFVAVSPLSAAEQLAKFGGTQVPVLEIGNEWKRDSTPIGIWLDELFSSRPLLPKDHQKRARILELDSWVSERFMPSIFRTALEADNSLAFKYRAWRLAALVSSHTPLPEEIRHNWPTLLKSAPFIQAMKPQMNMQVDAKTNQVQLASELLEKLQDGPFFGAMEHPTMVDLSLFPQIIFGVMAGLEENLSAAALPQIKSWLKRMADQMPANPILIRDDFVVRSLADALT